MCVCVCVYISTMDNPNCTKSVDVQPTLSLILVLEKKKKNCWKHVQMIDFCSSLFNSQIFFFEDGYLRQIKSSRMDYQASEEDICWFRSGPFKF